MEEHYTFGAGQAAIIKQLYHAGKYGHPYVHFNELLTNAGSQTILYLRELFKAKPYWRKLVHKGEKGSVG